MDALVTAEDLDKPEERYPLDVALCANLRPRADSGDRPARGALLPGLSLFFLLFRCASGAFAQECAQPDRVPKITGRVAALSSWRATMDICCSISSSATSRSSGSTRRKAQRSGDGEGNPYRCARSSGKIWPSELRAEGKRADVILANNVLAHVADLHGFVEGIAILLKEHGVAVIEVPYVKDLIDHCEFDTIYHEHLCYFSVTALVQRCSGGTGSRLEHVEHYPIHGGSLRLVVGTRPEVADSVCAYLKEEADQKLNQLGYYKDFASKVAAIKEALRNMLHDLKAQGKTLAAYGAAAKGSILLNYAGIDADLIDFVVDRNVHKQGRFMPGVHIPIYAPGEGSSTEMPDYVLVLPWNFKEEILQQQAEYRRRGGRSSFPIPFPEIGE